MIPAQALGPLVVVGCLLTGVTSIADTALEATYGDPFDYCAAVGTADASGPRYFGPAMPDVLAWKLKEASGAAADAPLALFREGGFWRCMGGEVYACTVGAHLPCMTKPERSREASTPMQRFCRDQPDAEAIPAVVTGRATVYAWRCSEGQPVTASPPKTVDAAGFFADIWYRIERK